MLFHPKHFFLCTWLSFHLLFSSHIHTKLHAFSPPPHIPHSIPPFPLFLIPLYPPKSPAHPEQHPRPSHLLCYDLISQVRVNSKAGGQMGRQTSNPAAYQAACPLPTHLQSLSSQPHPSPSPLLVNLLSCLARLTAWVPTYICMCARSCRPSRCNSSQSSTMLP